MLKLPPSKPSSTKAAAASGPSRARPRLSLSEQEYVQLPAIRPLPQHRPYASGGSPLSGSGAGGNESSTLSNNSNVAHCSESVFSASGPDSPRFVSQGRVVRAGLPAPSGSSPTSSSSGGTTGSGTSGGVRSGTTAFIDNDSNSREAAPPRTAGSQELLACMKRFVANGRPAQAPGHATSPPSILGGARRADSQPVLSTASASSSSHTAAAVPRSAHHPSSANGAFVGSAKTSASGAASSSTPTTLPELAVHRVTPSHVTPSHPKPMQTEMPPSPVLSAQKRLTRGSGSNGSLQGPSAGSENVTIDSTSPAPDTVTVSPRPQALLSSEDISEVRESRRKGSLTGKRKKSQPDDGESVNREDVSSLSNNDKGSKKARKGSQRGSKDKGTSAGVAALFATLAGVVTNPSTPPTTESAGARGDGPSPSARSPSPSTVSRKEEGVSADGDSQGADVQGSTGSMSKPAVATSRRSSFPRRPSTRDGRKEGGSAHAAGPLNLDEAALKNSSLSLDDVAGCNARPLSRHTSNLSQRQQAALQRTPSFLSRHHTPPPAVLREELHRVRRRRRVPNVTVAGDNESADSATVDDDDTAEGSMRSNGTGSAGTSSRAPSRSPKNAVGGWSAAANENTSLDSASVTATPNAAAGARAFPFGLSAPKPHSSPSSSAGAPISLSGAKISGQNLSNKGGVDSLSISTSSTLAVGGPERATTPESLRRQMDHLTLPSNELQGRKVGKQVPSPHRGAATTVPNTNDVGGGSGQATFTPVGMLVVDESVEVDVASAGRRTMVVDVKKAASKLAAESSMSPKSPPPHQTGSASDRNPRSMVGAWAKESAQAADSGGKGSADSGLLNVSYSLMGAAAAGNAKGGAAATVSPTGAGDAPLPTPPPRRSNVNTVSPIQRYTAPTASPSSQRSVSPVPVGTSPSMGASAMGTVSSESLASLSGVQGMVSPPPSASRNAVPKPTALAAANGSNSYTKEAANLELLSPNSNRTMEGSLTASDLSAGVPTNAKTANTAATAPYLEYANRLIKDRKANGTLKSSPTTSAGAGKVEGSPDSQPVTAKASTEKAPLWSSPPPSQRVGQPQEGFGGAEQDSSVLSNTAGRRQKQRIVQAFFDDDDDDDIFGSIGGSSASLKGNSALAATVAGATTAVASNNNNNSTNSAVAGPRPIKQDLVQTAAAATLAASAQEEEEEGLLEGFRPEGFDRRRGSRVRSDVTFFLNEQEDSICSDDEIVGPSAKVEPATVGTASGGRLRRPALGPRPAISFAPYVPPHNSALLFSLPSAAGAGALTHAGGASYDYGFDSMLLGSSPHLGQPALTNGYNMPALSAVLLTGAAPQEAAQSQSGKLATDSLSIYSLPMLSGSHAGPSPPTGKDGEAADKLLLPPPPIPSILLAKNGDGTVLRSSGGFTAGVKSKYAPDPARMYRPVANTFGLRGKRKAQAAARAQEATSTDGLYDDYDDEDDDGSVDYDYDDAADEEGYEWYWEEVEEGDEEYDEVP